MLLCFICRCYFLCSFSTTFFFFVRLFVRMDISFHFSRMHTFVVDYDSCFIGGIFVIRVRVWVDLHSFARQQYLYVTAKLLTICIWRSKIRAKNRNGSPYIWKMQWIDFDFRFKSATDGSILRLNDMIDKVQSKLCWFANLRKWHFDLDLPHKQIDA